MEHVCRSQNKSFYTEMLRYVRKRVYIIARKKENLTKLVKFKQHKGALQHHTEKFYYTFSTETSNDEVFAQIVFLKK